MLVSPVPGGVFQVCVTLGAEARLGRLSHRGAGRVDSSVRVSDLVPSIGTKR